MAIDINRSNDSWLDLTDSSVLIAITLPALIVPLMIFICIPLICLIKFKKNSPVKSEDDEEEIQIEGLKTQEKD
jgi:hypothetical protein